jgi:hypothetical protein
VSNVLRELPGVVDSSTRWWFSFLCQLLLFVWQESSRALIAASELLILLACCELFGDLDASFVSFVLADGALSKQLSPAAGKQHAP